MNYNLERRQLELEEESRLNGGKRTMDRIQKHVENKSESLTTYGKRITSGTVQKVAIAIKEKIMQVSTGPKLISVEKLEQIDHYRAATITIRFIVDAISTKGRKFTATAIALGGKIEDEIWANNLNEHNPYLIDKVIDDIDSRSVHYGYKKYKLGQTQKKIEYEYKPWTTKEKLHVGEALFEIFINTTGAISIKPKP